MNVQGPAPAVFRPLVTGTAAGAPATAPAPAASRTPDAASAPAKGGGAATESALWDVLTDEERAFFTQQAQLGSISYGPARAAAANRGAPVGQRIDVRG